MCVYVQYVYVCIYVCVCICIYIYIAFLIYRYILIYKIYLCISPFQSGFRPQHSTEIAIVKVVNDLLLSCDTGSLSLLLLLASVLPLTPSLMIYSSLDFWLWVYLVLLFPGSLLTYMTDSFTFLLRTLDPLLPP